MCLPGAPVTCDDQSPCTVDACDPVSGCTKTPLPGGVCDDGNACTQGDSCAGGFCTGALVVCDDQNACTSDSCDPADGCQTQPAAAGAPCDDGNACTADDACEAGQCVGTDTGCECEVDADCAPFEDNDLCNGTLRCDQSALPYSCEVDAETVVTCALPALTDPGCATALCNPDDGTCATTLAADGALCNDGSACTQADICAAGACTGTTIVCSDSEECTFDLCDPATGCVFEPALGFKACDDSSVCTQTDLCVGGVCTGGDLQVCEDTNPCTADSCDPTNGCSFEPLSGVACDDGEPCTQGSACLGGVCIGEALGCDDGEVCNGLETCALGQGCQDGEPLACDDGVACTVDSCVEPGGCDFAPDASSCDDGGPCNGLEICAPDEGCGPGIAPQVDDSIPCTQDACDPETGEVSHVPIDAACLDEEPCTVDTCSPTTGCVHTGLSDGVECDDGTTCTQGASCASGVCTGGQPCALLGMLCTSAGCVPSAGLSADVRFVSLSAAVQTPGGLSAQLLATPTVGGAAKAPSGLEAVFSALAKIVFQETLP